MVCFLTALIQQDGLLEVFGEELWYTTVESISVHANGNLAVTFKDVSIVSIWVPQKNCGRLVTQLAAVLLL